MTPLVLAGSRWFSLCPRDRSRCAAAALLRRSRVVCCARSDFSEVPGPAHPLRPGSPSERRPGVRTFETAAQLRTALKDSDFAERLFSTAFGSTRSKSSSCEIGTVSKREDGAFDVTVKMNNFRTGA